MDNKRAQTFEALEAFIQTQRALLARTQSDITRLQKLRDDATTRPAAFMSNLDQELNETMRHVSDPCDAQLVLPTNIDWSLYDAHDPKAMQTLTLNAQRKHEQRNTPCPYQRSELSALQKLVKDARRTIVDPVLAVFECVSDLEPDEDDDGVDAGERKWSAGEKRREREREREKLRELKKRKIWSQRWGGLGLPEGYGHGHGQGGAEGVFIRRDVEDESVEVDVTLDVGSDADAGDGKPIASSSSSSVSRGVVPPSPKISRTRVPSYKSKSQHHQALNGTTKKTKTKAKHKNKSSDSATPNRKESNAGPTLEHDDSASPTPAPATKRSRAEKPKPETYKQAWSVSEQHLLEQLLEEIPEGEKNRWQKISRAMNGRRTPRQVASRVQKYFEKLKRFGIGPGLEG